MIVTKDHKLKDIFDFKDYDVISIYDGKCKIGKYFKNELILNDIVNFEKEYTFIYEIPDLKDLSLNSIYKLDLRDIKYISKNYNNEKYVLRYNSHLKDFVMLNDKDQEVLISFNDASKEIWNVYYRELRDLNE